MTTMGRIHLKRRHKIKKSRKVLLITFLFLVSVIWLLITIGKKINPFFLDYTRTRVERFTTFILNDAMDEEVMGLLEKDELFKVSQDSENAIADLSFNTALVNQLLKTITDKVLIGIKKFEEGTYENPNRANSLMYDGFTVRDDGLVCEIPLGLATGSSLFMNILPIIPIKITFVGYMNSYIKTNVTSYGINDVLIELQVHVMVSQKMVMPFYVDNVVIEKDIPVGYKMIKGQIPNYYFETGFSKNSNMYQQSVN